jgi:hypothetical protein
MVKNNWYRYRYDDQEYDQPKTSFDQIFTTSIFTKNTKIFDSYKDALLFNAREIVNDFDNPKFALMLSGGSDSEIMFKASLESGVKFNTYIFRYENDSNLYDIAYAIVLCESHDVKYKLIDFNATKFFETEALKFAELAQTDRPRALPQLKFMDYVDEEYCLYGQGDINWKRINHDDYSKKGQWVHSCNEHEISWEKYLKATGRKGVPLWFKYTPELQLATAMTNWSQKLINDKMHGKAGTSSSKLIGYREAYPDIHFRIKKTGFESYLNLVTEVEKKLIELNGGLVNRQSYYRPAFQYISELKGIG